jgi:hypothetical protein
VPITVHIREYSWVIYRDERHLDEVRERVVVAKLCKVLVVVDESVASYSSTRIGYEDVPMHWFSASSGSEDVWFFVLDGETDEGEGSKAFFCGEVSRMKGEKVK